ncbi:Leucine-rich repeat protein kinase family protein [Rhynchospora pubera]|uniref:non-specific serine/threonine protein kinase n=1 Tax=Rhynchospora pubera TaxID=906938 RepID=A0AAV8F6X5_9POAL|nr:Leucine-rich repeat protein kinase family protein [Rhynchospora pubera]
MEISYPLIILVILLTMTKAQVPGFVNIDCGGTSTHTDDIRLQWTPDTDFPFGQRANTSFRNNNKTQYNTVRFFPADDRKYCYTLNTTTRLRYLVRATFLYGNFDNTNDYPKFVISLGATYWDTIIIKDAATPVLSEMVVLAPSPSLTVCLFNASSGLRFISTIELRQFNGSMYYTLFEDQYFMFMAARVNFGAHGNASIRYPDDPFDRIWESDAVKRPNYLVDVAPGTAKISTTKPIYVNRGENPPVKVMQTAVVGNNGTLTYRMNLDNFPGNAWAFTYMAEIENLGPNETRQFKVVLPWGPPINDAIVNVQENANGNYRLYEPGFYNVSLPFIASLDFRQTNDSLRGPILNAFEVFKYVLINFGSADATAMAGIVASNPQAIWAQEGGDPCLPVSWSWIQCNSDSNPAIISIDLSGKNLTGHIPQELTSLTALVEIYLNGNTLIGSVPDFGGFLNLQIIHLENNELTGPLPSSWANLPNLKEVYVQNNNLSGVIPKGLLRENIAFNYSGNLGLHPSRETKSNLIIIFSTIGAGLLLLLFAACYLYKYKKQGRKRGKIWRLRNDQLNVLGELDTEPAHRFELSEIEDATGNFDKLIGKGGFGSVYYGKLDDGSEIAVKVHNTESNQGIREFINEVTLLSRIHHKNLVKFLGYSQQEGNHMLVYEFMHEGTLTEHLRGPPEKKITSWVTRMDIAEDAAKGIEYLHTGCLPAVIHRDLKSSNILLDMNMRAKVSDFGLSKLMADGSKVSSMIRGTFGYLDPEYYATQQFTVKSDIFGFGIILLELVSGYSPISAEHFGDNSQYIVEWARKHIESGNIHAIIDKSLEPTYEIQSVWKITEVALMCVKPRGMDRPSISEVLKEIQEAILIEQKAATGRVESIDIFARRPPEFAPKLDISISAFSTESFAQPSLR